MSPTEKQLFAISIIEKNLGIPFLGSTRKDAIKYISTYLARSKQVSIDRAKSNYNKASFKWNEYTDVEQDPRMFMSPEELLEDEYDALTFWNPPNH